MCLVDQCVNACQTDHVKSPKIEAECINVFDSAELWSLLRVLALNCVSALSRSAHPRRLCSIARIIADHLTIGLTRANAHQSAGKLLGNTTATVATVQSSSGLASLGFVFTDLAVDGPYSGYVLVFESSGLAWPVQPTESLPFDVQYATRS